MEGDILLGQPPLLEYNLEGDIRSNLRFSEVAPTACTKCPSIVCVAVIGAPGMDKMALVDRIERTINRKFTALAAVVPFLPLSRTIAEAMEEQITLEEEARAVLEDYVGREGDKKNGRAYVICNGCPVDMLADGGGAIGEEQRTALRARAGEHFLSRYDVVIFLLSTPPHGGDDALNFELDMLSPKEEMPPIYNVDRATATRVNFAKETGIFTIGGTEIPFLPKAETRGGAARVLP
jgi:hypothetical protein